MPGECRIFATPDKSMIAVRARLAEPPQSEANSARICSHDRPPRDRVSAQGMTARSEFANASALLCRMPDARDEAMSPPDCRARRSRHVIC